MYPISPCITLVCHVLSCFVIGYTGSNKNGTGLEAAKQLLIFNIQGNNYDSGKMEFSFRNRYDQKVVSIKTI